MCTYASYLNEDTGVALRPPATLLVESMRWSVLQLSKRSTNVAVRLPFT